MKRVCNEIKHELIRNKRFFNLIDLKRCADNIIVIVEAIEEIEGVKDEDKAYEIWQEHKKRLK